jgi:hypothetical protein
MLPRLFGVFREGSLGYLAQWTAPASYVPGAPKHPISPQGLLNESRLF